MATKQALVYGGCGALGRVAVSAFKAAGWKVYSVDFSESQDADVSIALGKGSGADLQHVKDTLAASSASFDAVVSFAGGWAGGNIASDSILESVEKMYNYNILSAVAASHVASQFLSQNGLLVLTGAHAAFEGTSGMIGYGISKAATHQLIRSISGPGNGLKDGVTVVGVCPITLDTPMNRQGMPNADFGTWTPLQFVADLVVGWATGDRPESGSLLSLVTKEGKTEVVAKTPKQYI